MKSQKNTKLFDSQHVSRALDGIKNIHAFSDKDIESIKSGDSFVLVPTQELSDLRVQVYSFLI